MKNVGGTYLTVGYCADTYIRVGESMRRGMAMNSTYRIDGIAARRGLFVRACPGRDWSLKTVNQPEADGLSGGGVF